MTESDITNMCDLYEPSSASYCRSHVSEVLSAVLQGDCSSICRDPLRSPSSGGLVRRSQCMSHSECPATFYCANLSYTTTISTTTGCIACSYCIPLSSASSIDGQCTCLGGITVSSPHVGDFVYTGVTFTLLFYMPPSQTTFNLYLFYDGQMSAYGVIGYNLASTGAYSITLPQGIPSGKAFLYIQGFQNNTYQGRSDTFTLLPGGVQIFQPNISSSFLSGSPMTISYTANGFASGTQLQFQFLQKNVLSILLTIGTVTVSSVPNTVASLSWTIPSSVPTNQYFIVATPVGIYSPIYAQAPPSVSVLGDTGFSITQPTCTSHTACSSTQYCAARGTSGVCYACSYCLQFFDAYDGTCPSKCGYVGVAFGTSQPNAAESDVVGAPTLPSCQLPTNLVYNNASNIVFAAATSTNNPRMMTARLSTFLTSLANSVATTFPGFTLSVLSAASTVLPGPGGNVTYATEGRSATLTLVPAPTQTTLALLGGLAVTTGIDYVAFRTAGSIYVSVTPAQCLADIDLVFLLDVSTSIEMPFYGGAAGTFAASVLPFVNSVISSYQIGPNNTRVAVVTFSTAAQVVFAFTYTDLASTIAAVNAVPYTTGGTRTSTALALVRTNIVPLMRSNFGKVLITVTDGNANYGYNGLAEAQLLQALGVNMFAVGVGMAIDYAQIQAISTPPTFSHVYQLQSYNFLRALTAKMSSQVCGAPLQVTPGVMTNYTLDDCETQYFQPLCAQYASFVVQLSTSLGSTHLYVSRNTLQPSSYSYDFVDDSNNKLKTIQITRTLNSNSSVYLAVQGTGNGTTSFGLQVWSDVFNGVDSTNLVLYNNVAVNTVVYAVAPLTVVDASFTAALNYSITNGSSSGVFAINSVTGALSVVAPLTAGNYVVLISATTPSMACLSGVLKINVTVLVSNQYAPKFVSPTSASVREDAAAGTVVLYALAVTNQSASVITYSMGTSAVCTSSYFVVTGSFPSYAGSSSRANCMFWATPTGNVADYSCAWHGCYGPATPISSTTILCPMPDWTQLPAHAASYPIRVTVRVYATATPDITVATCLSSQGLLPTQWAASSYASFSLSTTCPTAALPVAAAAPVPAPSAACVTPTISSLQCLTNVPAGCPPPYTVNPTTGAVTLTTAYTSGGPSQPVPIVVLASQTITTDTTVLYAASSILITVVPVPCAAGTYSSDGSLPCTACPSQTYASSTGSTQCSPCTCANSATSYITTPCTATQAPVCTPCPSNAVASADGLTCNCPANYYRAPNSSCFACTVCGAGSYQVSACTPNADTVCAVTRVCVANQEYQTQDATATSNRQCTACLASCPAGTQPNPAFPCGPFADRQCQACPSGTYSASASLATCTACTTYCPASFYLSGTCSAYTSPSCVACTTAASCGANQYLTGTCTNTSSPSCANCITCPSGSYEVSPCAPPSGRVCQACQTSCPAGQYLSGTCAGTNWPTCLACTSSCASNQYLNGSCSVSSNTNCAACSTSCATCVGSSASQCTSCPAGTFLLGLSCVSSCGAGLYGDTATWTCKSCDSSCAACNGGSASSCLSCAAPLSLNNGQCVSSCPAGKYSASQVCVACAACAAGSYVTGGCAGSQNTACATWTVCTAGKYETAGPTATSDRTCANCTSTCPAGSQLSNTCGGTVNNACTTCAAGTYKPLSGAGACQSCVNSCPAGQTLTGTCTATTSPSCVSCTTAQNCPSGQYLSGVCTNSSNPTCVACDSCAAGTYETTACTGSTNRVCAACRTADQCAAGQYLSGVCSSMVNPSCATCLTCTSSQYMAAQCTATSNRVCQACSSQCATCTSGASTACTTCTAPLVLSGGSCVSNCSVGYYKDSNSVCQPCTSSCNVCTSPTACVQCAAGKFLLNGQCVSSCNAGQYADTASGQCLDCAVCGSGTFTASACTTTHNTVCTAISGVCASGSFVSQPATATSDRVCSACLASCPAGQQLTGVCGGSSNPTCTACQAGTYNAQVNGTCAACTASCPTSYYLVGQCTATTTPVCLPCTSSCSTNFYLSGTCTQTTTPTCVQCASCSGSQFETTSCTVSTNRVCQNCLTSCSGGSYLTGSCTTTTSPSCASCATAQQCSVTQYLLGQCTNTSNPACTACTECTATQYQTNPCTRVTNRVCASCLQASQCLSGTYLLGSCPGSVTATYPSTTVVLGKTYAVLDGTGVGAVGEGCQSGVLALPAGWAVAADDAASLTAIAAGTFGTSCIVVASGNAYAAGTGAACATACPAGGCLTTTAAGYGVAACNMRILVSLAPPTCVSCLASCAAGSFLAGTCGGTSNRYCQACTPCAAGTYETTPCSGSQDRVCSPCTLASSCAAGSYLTGSCTATTTPSCVACTASCAAGSYLTGTCGGTSNPACAACATCAAGSYQVQACQGAGVTSNTVCAACTTSCPSGQSLQGTCTATASPQCVTCLTSSQCNPGTYLTGTCGVNQLTSCASCDPSCATCSGGNATQCLSCTGGTTLLTANGASTCVSQCPAGSFRDTFLNTCVACDASCATCSGRGATSCLSCAAPNFFSAGACVGTCPAGTYGNTAQRACVACSTCGSQFFASGCGVTDTTCTALTVCQAGAFQSTAPTATSDRACSACATGTYQPYAGQTSCINDQPCVLGVSYQTAAATATSPTVCAAVTPCSASQFLSTPATLLANNVCTALTQCTSSQYISVAATATSDRTCTAVTTCTAAQYISTQATASTDAVCTNLTVCVPGQQIVVASTLYSNRVCEACPAGTTDSDGNFNSQCVACGVGTYEPAESVGACASFACAPGTADTDLNPATSCVACPTNTYTSVSQSTACVASVDCRAGYYVSAMPTPTSAAACLPCAPSTFKPTVGNFQCTAAQTCTAAQYISVPSTSVSDTNCSTTTVCTAGQFEVVASTVTSDRVCANYKSCPVLTWQSFGGNATADIVCTACRTCTADQYVSQACTATSNAECQPVTTCLSTEYQTAAPTATTNRACATTRVCTTGTEYQTVAPTATSDCTCAAVTSCTAAQYETAAPTATTDRVCPALTLCAATEFQSAAPTATTNRQCAAVAVCSPPTTYQSVAATATSDAKCSTTTACDAVTEYENAAPTYTSNRACLPQPLPVQTPEVAVTVTGGSYAAGVAARSGSAFVLGQWGQFPNAVSSSGSLVGTVGTTVGAAAYTVPLSLSPGVAAGSQCIMMHSTTVIADAPVVAASVQTFDARGNALHSNTIVAVRLQASDGTLSATSNCLATSSGACSVAVTVPSSWFGTRPTATLLYTVGGSAVMTCASLTLVAPQVAAAVANDVLLSVPQSNVFRGTVFAASVQATTATPLSGFNVELNFTSGLSLAGLSYNFELWSVSVTQFAPTAYIVAGQLLNPAATPDLSTSLLDVSLSVSAGAAATEHISCILFQLLDINGVAIAPGGRTTPTPSRTLDRNGMSYGATVYLADGASLSGLAVVPALGQIVNLAPVTGQAFSVALTYRTASMGGATAIATAGITCSLDTPAAASLSADCGALTFSGVETASGTVTVTATIGSVTAHASVTVWLPTSVSVALSRPVLNALQFYPVVSCTATTYTRGAVAVLAVLSAGAASSPTLDITSLVSSAITSSAPAVATVAGGVVRGVAPGTAAIRVSNGATVLAQATVTVSATPVRPTRLDASVVTSVSVAAIATQLAGTLYVGNATAVSGPLTADSQLAYMAVSAVLSDGTRLSLGPADGVFITTSDAATVGTNAAQQVQARANSAGTPVSVAWSVPCTAATSSTMQTAVTVVVALPAVTSVAVVLSGTVVTPAGSAAALAPTSLAVALGVRVIAYFADSTSKDVSTDVRTALSFAQGASLVAFANLATSPVVSATGAAGHFVVAASFLGVSGQAAADVVVGTALTVQATALPGSAALVSNTLSLLSGTAVYETAALRFSLALSSGTSVDVTAGVSPTVTGPATATIATDGSLVITPQAAGTVVAAVASYGGLATSLTLTVAATSVSVSAINSFALTSSLVGELGALATTATGVTLSDGQALSGVLPAGLVQYASSVPAAASISTTGLVTLLGNSAGAVALTASAPNAAAASVSVVCNLNPGVGDIDFGALTGVALPAAGLGTQVTVDVRINTGTAALGVVEFSVNFPSALRLLAVLPPAGWTGGLFLSATGTAGDVTIGPTTSLYGIVSIATLVFVVSDLSVATATVSGRVLSLRDKSGAAIGAATPRAIVAGQAPMTIIGGGRRRSLSVSGPGVPCVNAPCAVCSTTRPLGDTNGDCVFDGLDVSYAVFVAGQVAQSPQYASTLLPAQQAALDADGSGAVDLRDSMLLSKALFGLTAFVTNLAVAPGARPGCLVSVTATLTMRGGVAPAANSIALFVIAEGSASALQASTLTAGTVAATATLQGVVYEAAALGAGSYALSLASSAAQTVKVSLVVVTAGNASTAARTMVLQGDTGAAPTIASSVAVTLMSVSGIDSAVSLPAHNPLATAAVAQSALSCHTVACGTAQYITAPATMFADTQCAPDTNCTAAQYQTAAATATTDRACAALTTCTAAQYQSRPATATTDRACTALTTCTSSQYASTAPTATTDRACNTTTVCTSAQYQTQAPTATSNRVCAAVTTCNYATQYASTPATATSNAVCSALTVCSSSQVEVTAPTTSTDRVCAQNFCAFTPCENGGTCVNSATNYECSCPSGFHGTRCEVADDPCAINPCLNGGECMVFDGLLTCQCPEAFCNNCCATAAGDQCTGGGLELCEPTSSGATGSSGAAANVPTIAGAALGGFLGLILLVAAVMYVMRHRARQGAKSFDGGDQTLSVFPITNPTYREVLPENTLTPNYMRCVAVNMWHGQLLRSTNNTQLLAVHDMLGLPRPAPTQMAPLREHTMQFLDSIVPPTPEIVRDAMVNECVTFMLDALPDILVDIALDVVVATAGEPDDTVYEHFYAALSEIGAEYEAIGHGDYDLLMDGTGEYMETSPEMDPLYSLAAGSGGSAYYMAPNSAYGTSGYASQQGPYEAPYNTLTTEGTYSLAGSGAYGSLTAAPEVFDVADGDGYATASYEPEYMAPATDPLYLPASDPTYSLAAAEDPYQPANAAEGAYQLSGDHTYALGRGDAETDDSAFNLDAEPVYDNSDDTA